MGLTSSAEGVAGGKFYCGTSRKSIGWLGEEGDRKQHTPHASNKLSKTTNEAGHADDGIGDGDTASLDVDQREDEGGAREGEETAERIMSNLRQVSGRGTLTGGPGCR